jgi:hypothetical protein
VSYNIISLYESFLEIFRKIRKGGTGVNKIGVAASSWRRKDDCSKNRVGSPSWIKRRIDMEKSISLLKLVSSLQAHLLMNTYLIILSSSAVRFVYIAIVINISSIKKLKMLVAEFATGREIRSDVVELSKAA